MIVGLQVDFDFSQVCSVQPMSLFSVCNITQLSTREVQPLLAGTAVLRWPEAVYTGEVRLLAICDAAVCHL